MQVSRILSLWFPRLAAERLLRADPALAGRPLVVVGDRRGALVLASLTAEAEAAGLRPGMALGDARAILPGLVSRPEDPEGLARTRRALRRWAGRFSPWVAEDATGLTLDVTGCARLFGGEAALVARAADEAAGFGLTLRLGLADTLGAAWAVARFAGTGALPAHAGDAIDQEARATRSRAQKRRWERGGPPPLLPAGEAADPVPAIVPSGQARVRLAPMPVAALRLEPQAVERLQALGIARVGDLAALPREAVTRRFGPDVGRRLDQALGRLPEPVSPAPPDPVFAVRLTLPEPIGRSEDVLAGIDRLLPPLAARLAAAGKGARRLRLTLVRTDGGAVVREAGLARPTIDPATIRPLLALRLDDVDAGFGIDRLRLEATTVEAMPPRQQGGPAGGQPDADGLADLIGRLGARLGIDAVVRLHPAESHLPEKATIELPAAFSEPAEDWPWPPAPRPILLLSHPEPIGPDGPTPPPEAFVWRRRRHRTAIRYGPERITPEWWIDHPAWRSGARDYWRIETEAGDRLWLYEAKGGEAPGGWFVHGVFA